MEPSNSFAPNLFGSLLDDDQDDEIIHESAYASGLDIIRHQEQQLSQPRRLDEIQPEIVLDDEDKVHEDDALLGAVAAGQVLGSRRGSAGLVQLVKKGLSSAEMKEIKTAAKKGKDHALKLLHVMSVSMDTREVEKASVKLRAQLDNRPYGHTGDAVNNHYVSWARAGAIKATLNALRNHSQSVRVAVPCLASLRCLASCKWSRFLVQYTGAQLIDKRGGVPIILKVMKVNGVETAQDESTGGSHLTDLQADACRILGTMADMNQDIRNQIKQGSGDSLIQDVMHRYRSSECVQRAGHQVLAILSSNLSQSSRFLGR